MSGPALHHVPVLAAEVVEALVLSKSGAYLDATSGSGGHCVAILRELDGDGRLYAVDRDDEAVSQTRAATAAHAGQVTALRGRFSDLSRLAAASGLPPLDGILFDLGMSSHQLDTSARGFSYQVDGPLDMRMNREAGRTAGELLEEVSEPQLAAIIKEYGEERGARKIARSICASRGRTALMTTSDLRDAVEATHPTMPSKTLARVFQALRIWVNDELEELRTGLQAATGLVATRGRIAVIAYHSLEDRIVKSFFGALVRGCVCPPKLPVCACGRKPEFSKILRCRPRGDEIQRNPRARSAIMRAFEHIGADD